MMPRLCEHCRQGLGRETQCGAFDNDEIALGRINRNEQARDGVDFVFDGRLVAPLNALNLAHPLFLHGKSCLGGALGNDAAAEGCARICGKPFDNRFIGHHRTDAQSCQAQPFGETVGGDRPLGIEPRSQDMIVGEIAIGAIMQDATRRPCGRYRRMR